MEPIIFYRYIILCSIIGILTGIGICKLIIKYLDKRGYLKRREK